MKDFTDFLRGFDLHTLILLGVAVWFLNSNFNEKFDKLSDKVEDVDRRLCRIEGSSMAYCYAKNNSKTMLQSGAEELLKEKVE